MDTPERVPSHIGTDAPQQGGILEEAVRDAEVVITMLPAGHHVRSVYANDVFPNAPKGALLVDCSTIDVDSARAVGAQAARRVAWLGLLPALLLSAWFANWHIALASGTAFMLSQWMDIAVFNRWRSHVSIRAARVHVRWC